MSTSPQPAAFTDLRPEQILDALEAVGLRGDGRLLQLNSFENRVFQVHLESSEVVVVKFYRPGRWTDEQILEEHQFALELQAQDIPVVAPLTLHATAEGNARVAGPANLTEGESGCASADGPGGTLAFWGPGPSPWRFSVSPRKSGRAPELEDPEVVRWIGRFLARLHTLGAGGRFAHRPELSPQTLGRTPQRWLSGHADIPPTQQAAWESASRRALDRVQALFDTVADVTMLRLHGDAHPGNILWRPEGPHVVDLDDARTGPAVQDLWMLLPGDSDGAQRHLRWLLEGYESIRDFDDRELRLIEPLRTLRMIHHSAWIAQRWVDPAFPAAFPHFGTAAYWSEQTGQLLEQLERMQT